MLHSIRNHRFVRTVAIAAVRSVALALIAMTSACSPTAPTSAISNVSGSWTDPAVTRVSCTTTIPSDQDCVTPLASTKIVLDLQQGQGSSTVSGTFSGIYIGVAALSGTFQKDVLTFHATQASGNIDVVRDGTARMSGRRLVGDYTIVATDRTKSGRYTATISFSLSAQ